MSRKMLPLVVLAFAIVAAFALAVDVGDGADDMNIKASEVQIIQSDKAQDVTVDFTLSNNPGVWSIMVRAGYDSSFSIKSVSNGEIISQVETSLINNPYLYYTEGAKLIDYTGNGNLFSIVFTVPADTPEGKYDITLTKGDVINVAGNNITYTVTSGYIEVCTEKSITYTLDGGSGTAPTQDPLIKGSKFTVASYSGTKAGYTFSGWNDGQDTYQPGDEYTVGASDITLQAVWTQIHVESIRLDKTAADVTMGSTLQLTATVLPADALDRSVSWSSDSTDVATVANGLVTPVKLGTANITATANDGSFAATCAVTVKASDNTCGTDLIWSLSEGTLTVSGTGEMYDSTVGYAPWDTSAAAITSIIISDGVTSIGSNAFASCTGVKYVQIASSVTDIDSSAFTGYSFFDWNGTTPVAVSGIAGYTFRGDSISLLSKYAGELSITPARSTLLVGSETVFTVSLKSLVSINSLSLAITFDTKTFEFVEAEWLIDGTVKSIDAEHRGVITWNNPVTPDEAVLSFKLKAIALCDSADITVTGKADENTIPYGTLVKNVEVVDYIRGDMNQDQKVTSDDAIHLLFYTFYPEDYPIIQSGDVNGDGKVTSDDAIHLLFYTFYPEDYPLS